MHAMSEGHRLASTFGYVAFFALAGAVALGMLTALGGSRRWAHGTLEQVHLAVAIVALMATVTHIAAHTVRAVGGYAWWETVVPFARGGWIVALGVVGWLSLLALLVTLTLRQRLGYRRWVTLHLLAYVAAGTVAGHVVAASDEVAELRLVGVLVLASLVALAALGVRRGRGTDELRGAAAAGRWEAGR
jgi:sulfoxide reductase heme-binding subunit YedZ